jgi:hypothetical protein
VKKYRYKVRRPNGSEYTSIPFVYKSTRDRVCEERKSEGWIVLAKWSETPKEAANGRATLD